MKLPCASLQTPFRIVMLLVICSAVAMPADAGISVRGRLTHELELLPGASHTGTIVVANVGSRPEEVKLYQTDYRSELPARHYYDEPGTSPRSNAAWISFTPSRVVIPPGETHTVTYLLQVPPDAALSGTYWSVLMVEAIPPGSPEADAPEPDRPTVAVLQLIRYAVRLVTHIGTSGTLEPQILGPSLWLEDGEPVLGIDLANTGTRLLKLETWAEIYDRTGRLVARRPGSPASLFPGSTRRYRIPLVDLDRGDYTALVVLDAGDNNVYGASFPIRLE